MCSGICYQKIVCFEIYTDICVYVALFKLGTLCLLTSIWKLSEGGALHGCVLVYHVYIAIVYIVEIYSVQYRAAFNMWLVRTLSYSCRLMGSLELLYYALSVSRADSRFAHSQWETALLFNDGSHSPCASLESVLVNMHYQLILPRDYSRAMSLNIYSLQLNSEKILLQSS